MTTLGHPTTWLLVGVTWIGLSLLTALLVGAIARVGRGKDEGI